MRHIKQKKPVQKIKTERSVSKQIERNNLSGSSEHNLKLLLWKVFDHTVPLMRAEFE
jgi:hypothetical protein